MLQESSIAARGCVVRLVPPGPSGDPMEASGLPLTPRTLEQGALFCVQLQGGCGRQGGSQLRSPPYPNSRDGKA